MTKQIWGLLQTTSRGVQNYNMNWASSGLDAKFNNDKWRAEAGKLRDTSAFRTPLPRSTWERIDTPTFGGESFSVDGFKGSRVESGDKTYPVKASLAIPAGSADIDLRDAGPGQGKRARTREMLQDYARNLKDLIPSTGLTLARVAQSLRGMRGFIDTADVYGPSKAGRIVSFLKLYPNLFQIQGTGPNIKVFVAKTPEPRPARPGGASSSDQARERQPWTTKLIPELHIGGFRMIKG